MTDTLEQRRSLNVFELVLILAVLAMAGVIVAYLYVEPFHDAVNEVARRVFGTISTSIPLDQGGGTP